MISGTFKIKLIEGQIYIDKDTFSKMDPFCVVEHNKKKLKSKVQNDAGKFPKFNEEFVFEKTHPTLPFTLTLMEDELVGAAFLGENNFPISTHWIAAPTTLLLPIKDKAGGLIAEIKSELVFIPDKGEEMKTKDMIGKELEDLKLLVDKIKKGENINLPPPIFITPKLAKYINEKKEGKFALQNEITELEAQVKKLEDKKAVKENDKSEMIRKMDMGNLVKDQLKKHKNNIQDMINKYRKNDVIGSVSIQIRRGVFKNAPENPVILLKLGNQLESTKDYEEKDSVNVTWNEKIKLDKKTPQDEIVLFYLIDGTKKTLYGVGGVSIYSMIHSRLNEHVEIKLIGENGNVVGDLQTQIEFIGNK